MDFAGVFGASHAMYSSDSETNERHERIRRLFSLLTARCEDAAEIAVRGQARDISPESARDLAHRLHSIGQEISTVADAIAAILESPG